MREILERYRAMTAIIREVMGKKIERERERERSCDDGREQNGKRKKGRKRET